MKDINPEVIMAVGHADRLGSDSYNQRLSEQRVDAVKAYLVGLGIASNRMHTEGRGISAGYEGRRMRGCQERERYRLPATGPSRRHRSGRHPDRAASK
jgi:OOP family OmpA-OmpF porin